MSAGLLFGAGAIVTFITLWGVVMAGGLFATRHQPDDDVVVAAAEHAPVPQVTAVVVEPAWTPGPVPLRAVDG